MFVVAGEALMDVFTGATTPTGIALDARIGGSPLNVAFGLARMGQRVAFLGGISSGELGNRLVDALRAEGVSLDAVHRSAAPTTISLIGVDAKGVPEYAFYGTGAADRTLPLAALDRHARRRARAARRLVHDGGGRHRRHAARADRARARPGGGQLRPEPAPERRARPRPSGARRWNGCCRAPTCSS
jgi:sugar/nucleoside kinase (ribokinase family)